MYEFRCDIDPEEDCQLIDAFQTILDRFSSYKGQLRKSQKERENAVAQLKSLHDTLSISPHIAETPKRKRTANRTVELNISEANASVDLNNAAFFLSSSFGDDEDVIGPTQFTKTPSVLQGTVSPTRVNVDRLVVSRKPFVDRNKENFEKLPLTPSQAVLKPIKKCETIRIDTRRNLFAEAVADVELNDTKPSEQLFETNWISKKTTKVAEFDTPKSRAKKKNRLTLSKGQNTGPKLRQSTINFQKSDNDDETYCADLTELNQSVDDSESFSNTPNVSAEESIESPTEQIKMEKPSPTGTRAENPEPISPIDGEPSNSNKCSSGTILILDDPITEIITLEDTQATYVEFENICGNENDTKALTLPIPQRLEPYQPNDNAIATKVKKASKDANCPDCERYNQIVREAIGGKVDTKDLKFMKGKCTKHSNDSRYPETPPHFWDVKLIDTPEGEHIATPFDYRFIAQ